MAKKIILFVAVFCLLGSNVIANPFISTAYTYKGNFQRTGAFSHNISEKAKLYGAFTLCHPLHTFYALKDCLLINNKEDFLLKKDPGHQKVLWKSDLPYSRIAHPTLAENSLYFGTENGRMVCLDWNSGQERWSYPFFAKITSAPLVIQQKVIFGASDGMIYALSQNTGTLLWSLNAKSAVYADLAEKNGTIFVGTVEGRIMAISSAGSLIWDYYAEGTITQSIAVSSTYLVAVTFEGFLYCLNTDGTYRWHKISHPFVASSPIIQRGEVYQFFPDGYLRSYYLDTGEMRLSMYIECPLRQTPVMVSHMMLFRLWNGVLMVDTRLQQSRTLIFQEGFDAHSFVFSGKSLYLLMKTGEIFCYNL